MRDYPDEVKTAFSEQYGDSKDLSNAQRMNSQHVVAKSLLYREYAHLLDELGERAKAEHEVGMNEWDMVLGNLSHAENVVQCVYLSLFFYSLTDPCLIFRARESLFDAVYPLLQAIGSYAGCYVSLVAGSPKNTIDDGFFTA